MNRNRNQKGKERETVLPYIYSGNTLKRACDAQVWNDKLEK